MGKILLCIVKLVIKLVIGMIYIPICILYYIYKRTTYKIGFYSGMKQVHVDDKTARSIYRLTKGREKKQKRKWFVLDYHRGESYGNRK